MNPRPRIGVDFHVLTGKFQGSRSHLVGLYGALLRLCPQYDFFFFCSEPQRVKALPGFELPHAHAVAMPYGNALSRLGWHLPRLRRQLRLDVLHLQYARPWWGGGAHAVTIHDVLFEAFPQYFTPFFVARSRLFMRAAARGADLLFTVSEYSRQEIAQRYGVSAARISVLLNAVDPARFHPPRPEQAQRDAQALARRGLEPGGYLLTVGRIEPRKNHEILLQAYAALPGTPPPLLIVGQRDFGYGGFNAALARLPAQHSVHILDDVDDDELPLLYRHARLFAYPSAAEGFGMPPLEAMASGTPVITSTGSALPEVMGDAGLLVEPEAAALAAALQRLLDDPELATQLAARGLQRAAGFRWESAAAVLAERLHQHFSATGYALPA